MVVEAKLLLHLTLRHLTMFHSPHADRCRGTARSQWETAATSWPTIDINSGSSASTTCSPCSWSTGPSIQPSSLTLGSNGLSLHTFHSLLLRL